MQVVCEDRLPMSLDNMREGCRVFIRLGSCTMEVVGRLKEECREHSGHLWWVREEVNREEEMVRVKLINLFYACKQ